MAVNVKAPEQGQSPDLRVYLRTAAAQELANLKEMRAKLPSSQPSDLENPRMPSMQPQTANSSAELSPLESKYGVTQNYGNYNPDLYSGLTAGARHLGLDVATPSGTPVKSPFAGLVKTGENKDFGKFVEIRTQDGRIMRFSHLSSIDDLAQQLGAASREIQAGQNLGLTGSTGHSTGPHLDIMYQQGGQWTNPLNYEPLKKTLG